jgi:hypothetical protein
MPVDDEVVAMLLGQGLALVTLCKSLAGEGMKDSLVASLREEAAAYQGDPVSLRQINRLADMVASDDPQWPAVYLAEMRAELKAA